MTGVLIGILVVVVIVAAAVVVFGESRRARLRHQFGAEYDRLVKQLGNSRKARAELAARQRRVAKLGIRPISPEQRARYAAAWASLQEAFIDSPARSLTAADALVAKALRERGYSADGNDQAYADLSVRHARALDPYRQARGISEHASTASTEQLRTAVLGYRAMLDEMTGSPNSIVPAQRGRDGVGQHGR